MKTRIVQGWWRRDGGLLERGTLALSVPDPDSQYQQVVTADFGERVIAREFRVTPDVIDIEIVTRDGAWEFIPAGGECERIGMAVIPLAERVPETAAIAASATQEA